MPKSAVRRRRATVVAALAALALVAYWAAPGTLVSYDLSRARRAMADLDLDAARAWFQAAADRAPGQAEIHYLLGCVHRRARHYREAEQSFERAEKLGWPKRDVERQRTMMGFQMGDVDAAAPYVGELLKRGCDDATAEDLYEVLVWGYLSEFRISEGSVCLANWIAWRPDSIRARIWRARYYGSMLDAEKLRAELREILRIDPRRVKERIWLAQSLLDDNDVEAALVECELGRRQAPGDPLVSLVMGLCHVKQGLQDAARPELESAVAGDLEPRRRLQGLAALGQIALASGNFEEAAGRYKEATRCVPSDAAAEYGLGTTLAKLGEDEAAQTHLDRSRVLENQADRLNAINSALMDAPDNAGLRLEAARIMVDQGRTTDAAVWMSSALR
ncbi:MAG TPA: tetratricopeptide repeat protein, partial [Pirellulales bacterium]|nr:tetratricopeptide repeat protein [Pirellulales bacterium]